MPKPVALLAVAALVVSATARAETPADPASGALPEDEARAPVVPAALAAPLGATVGAVVGLAAAYAPPGLAVQLAARGAVRDALERRPFMHPVERHRLALLADLTVVVPVAGVAALLAGVAPSLLSTEHAGDAAPRVLPATTTIVLFTTTTALLSASCAFGELEDAFGTEGPSTLLIATSLGVGAGALAAAVAAPVELAASRPSYASAGLGEGGAPTGLGERAPRALAAAAGSTVGAAAGACLGAIAGSAFGFSWLLADGLTVLLPAAALGAPDLVGVGGALFPVLVGGSAFAAAALASGIAAGGLAGLVDRASRPPEAGGSATSSGRGTVVLAPAQGAQGVFPATMAATTLAAFAAPLVGVTVWSVSRRMGSGQDAVAHGALAGAALVATTAAASAFAESALAVAPAVE